jgi:FKBP-type peptidyl-prolyl cis-trans isomerase
MKLVQDSFLIRKGKPAYFKIGEYQVSKCWDVAFQQMKAGQTARVFCPANADKGGEQN